MDNQFQVVDNVNDFLSSFLTPETTVSNPTQTTPPVEQSAVQNFLTTKTEQTEGDKTPEAADSEGKVEEFLKETKPQEVVDNTLIKDVQKFSGILKEKAILAEFEDGSLPSTEDEFISALEQSIIYKADSRLEERWKEKIDNLPPSLQTIHQYAESGVVTAQQLAQFTNTVAQAEAIAQLDPKNPLDQEQIVLIQLVNTGMPEKDAQDEVADLKERNKLESRATQYFPTLKKSYEDNVRKELARKEQEEENFQRYIQDNAANAMYFLEKDTDYLPFKMAPNDKSHKQAVLQLAGHVVDRMEDGSPVFAWQKQIEALQFGDEASYKKYMKVMHFLANPDKYEENTGKKSASQSSENSFKKIKTTTSPQSSAVTTETPPVTTKKVAGPWSSR